ncbi:MAG: hypothetical protein AB4290_25850 [Spirulina sp.]
MVDWSHSQQLVELSRFYEQEAKAPEAFSDEELLHHITKTFWPTDCWCFVEESFAIIAPACKRRPHLVRELIYHPIDAMICGGLEDPELIIAQGVACTTKKEHYVEPSEEGKEWLIHDWPKFSKVAKEVFQEIWKNLDLEE